MDKPGHANIASISHIGGHKYAGNVIIYIPPGMTVSAETVSEGSEGRDAGSGRLSPLAGLGVWYGRVEPGQVEGLVDETVLGGRVVSDHFRGAVNKHGDVLRL